jgi:hypothetical protein
VDGRGRGLYGTLTIITEVNLGFPQLLTVAARSKALTVFTHSNAGIVSSNPTQGPCVVSVCVRLFSVRVVQCVGSGLATG